MSPPTLNMVVTHLCLPGGLPAQPQVSVHFSDGETPEGTEVTRSLLVRVWKS